jgi:predicted neuraminidase
MTDDSGRTWTTSTPLVGGGSIQPSIARRRDGTLVAFMRDNGPPPKRLHRSESADNGKTWSRVVDSDIPNPGSAAEVTVLRNGRWLLIYNDTERGRHRLAVSISDDEGKSWTWTRHLENDAPGSEAGSYSYPSIIQARDGSLHATYSYHLNRKDLAAGVDGKPARKSIKHARFSEEWVMRAGGR